MTRTVALLVGSLRKESWTRKVGHALRELAPEDMHLEEVPIGNLPLYNQDFDDQKRPPREWVEFRDRIRPMEAVVFATPEYNRSMPGVLKNAIDVGSRPYGSSVWAGKPVGVVSCSPGAIGGFGANQHLRQSLVFLDMPVLQQPEMYLGHIAKAFDSNGVLTDESLRGLLDKFMKALDAWIDLVLAGSQSAARKSA